MTTSSISVLDCAMNWQSCLWNCLLWCGLMDYWGGMNVCGWEDWLWIPLSWHLTKLDLAKQLEEKKKFSLRKNGTGGEGREMRLILTCLSQKWSCIMENITSVSEKILYDDNIPHLTNVSLFQFEFLASVESTAHNIDLSVSRVSPAEVEGLEIVTIKPHKACYKELCRQSSGYGVFLLPPKLFSSSWAGEWYIKTVLWVVHKDSVMLHVLSRCFT